MSEQFDVFLAHSSKDKPLIRQIYRQLQKRGIEPWLDEEQIVPGTQFQDEIQQAIGQIKTAAIFIGQEGLGRWQALELKSFINECVERGIPVIPVLLPGVEQIPENLIFLKNFHAVFFGTSIDDEKALFQLEWGITRIKPNKRGEAGHREKPKAQHFSEDLGNGIKLDMISIPGGKFMMGSPEGEGSNDEKPQHEVTVQAFYMGKYPITQAQYQEVMGNNPSHFKGDDQRPVEKVSWDDAVEFCKKLSKQTGKEYRLPTEAEWEYACRAGTATAYYFGENITKELANCIGSGTTAVGKYPPNVFGLYDMHGNVWEWCEDNWHDSYKGAPTDGKAWVSEDSNNNVIRGGSWINDPDSSRSAYRLYDARGDRIFNIGFRVGYVVSNTT